MTTPTPSGPYIQRAFTLVELLVVIALIGILTTLMVRSASGVQARVEKAHCIANLRSLHNALSSYIQDHNSWPQEPEDLSKENFGPWWIDVLMPYTQTGDVWRCKTMVRLQAGNPKEMQNSISYTPSQFDEHRITPFRWERQPWLIEVGDYHGGGNLIIFPDGSVIPAKDL